MTHRTSITYRDAGVDIDAGDELVERIKPMVKRSMRSEVIGGLGGFGALVEIPLERYKRPVLVSGTDGVGTKLRLAIDTARHDTIGIDLVAMCANDVVVQGAEPLFFLDYYATGRLDVDVAATVIKGIVEGCVQAGAALVGGETAEMPGMYHGEDYDLAGFCVGIVERDRIIDGSRTQAGDVVIGLPSSGPHSNGYSLIRKLLAHAQAGKGTMLEGEPLYDRLLAPTRIYVKPLLALLRLRFRCTASRTSPAAAFSTTFHAWSPTGWKSCSGAARGRWIRCSTGSGPPAISTTRRCTALSTAASA